MADPELLVDPAISRTKFDRELADYRAREDEYLRRGWWLLRAEFPEVFVVFATPRTKPPAVVFGVLLDFTNYDFWPPSVRLVDPFTREPYTFAQLPSQLPRRSTTPVPETVVALQLPGMGPPRIVQDLPLMQAHDPNEIPFLCLPGVREYHDHPGHSGDPWLLHRGRGEGTLHFLLETIHRYGVEPISGYQVQMVPMIGFGQQDVPE